MINLSELNNPTFDISSLAQLLFTKYYLVAFPPKKAISTTVEQDSKQFEITDPRIPRVTHGAQHASRVSALVKIIHLFRQDHHDITLNDLYIWGKKFNLSMTQWVHLMQIAGLFHDVARQGEGIDLWDQDSADECFHFFQATIPSLPEAIARIIANTIAYKDNKHEFKQAVMALGFTTEEAATADYLRQLVHDADCLDVMRVRKTFKMKFLDLCHVSSLRDKSDAIISLVIEVRTLINKQQDQWFDCNIVPHHEDMIHPAQLCRQFDLDVKFTYEWASNVYNTVIDDMTDYSHLQAIARPLEYIMPYPFHSQLRDDIRQAFMSALIVSEPVEASSPDKRDYFLMTFQTPITTSFMNGAQMDGPDVVAIIYSGDSMLTQRCNRALRELGVTVELGFRWHGTYDGNRGVELHGFSLKIIYPHNKYQGREAVFNILSLELEKAGLIEERLSFNSLMLPTLSASTEPQRPALSNIARFFKASACLPEIELRQSSAVKAYIKDHLSPVQALYVRDNELSINPSYQNSEAITCPLTLNQKKIWLLRSDFVLAVGNKNSNWTNFNDSSLAECIEIDLHAFVNWEDRYGHPSLATPHPGYDGSAYYGGYLAQRNDQIELYTFSGRYHRNDLSEFDKEILEAYIADSFQKTYGDQPIVFIDAVVFGPGVLDNFELSMFIRDNELPDYCTRRVYDREKIALVFDGCTTYRSSLRVREGV